MIRRILIMGAAGSGKSTLVTELAKLLRYPYRDTDDLYWLPTEIPFERKRKRIDQLQLVKEALSANGGLVLSGSFSGWGSESVPLVDAVVRLVVPTAVRLDRLRKRELERYGNAILQGGERHARYETFLTWAAAYDDSTESQRRFARDDAWFMNLPCPSLRIDGTQAFAEQLHAVHSWLTTIRG